MKTRELGDKLKLFLEKKTTFLPEYFRIGSLIKRKRQGSIEQKIVQEHLKTLGIGNSRSKVIRNRTIVKLAIRGKNWTLVAFLLKKYSDCPQKVYKKLKLALRVLDFLHVVKVSLKPSTKVGIPEILASFQKNLESSRHLKIPYFRLKLKETSLLGKRTIQTSFKIEDLMRLIYESSSERSQFANDILSNEYRSDITYEVLKVISTKRMKKSKLKKLETCRKRKVKSCEKSSLDTFFSKNGSGGTVRIGSRLRAGTRYIPKFLKIHHYYRKEGISTQKTSEKSELSLEKLVKHFQILSKEMEKLGWKIFDLEK